MCGAEVPRWVAKRLESFGDDRESIRGFGLDVVTALCERLLAAGVPGLHFYTLNAAGATKAIWQRLKLWNAEPPPWPPARACADWTRSSSTCST